MSEELIKKEQELEAIKSPEDAAKFYQEKKEQLKAVADPTSEESLQSALAALGQLFGEADGGDFSFDPPLSSDNNENTVSVETFFDLERFGQDDGSRAPPTPELSHSTNPSPESVVSSDADHSVTSHHSDTAGIADGTSSQTDDFFNDPMFALLKPLGGGASAYYVGPSFDFENDFLSMGDAPDAWAISS